MVRDIKGIVVRDISFVLTIGALMYGYNSCQRIKHNTDYYDTVQKNNHEREMALALRSPIVQTDDINGNGIAESFVIVGGVRYYSNIDGRSVESCRW